MNVPALRALQQSLRDHPEGFDMSVLENCFVSRITFEERKAGEDVYDYLVRKGASLGLNEDQTRELFMVCRSYDQGWTRWPEAYRGSNRLSLGCSCHPMSGDRHDVTIDQAIAFIDYFIEKHRPAAPNPTEGEVASALASLEEVTK